MERFDNLTKLKRGFSDCKLQVLFMLMMLLGISFQVQAQGLGTESNPFPIGTKAQLLSLAEKANLGSDFYFNPADSLYYTTNSAGFVKIKYDEGSARGSYFRLTDDIEINSGDVAACAGKKSAEWVEWPMLGTSSSPFAGVLDGNYHIISGLYVNRDDVHVGLCGNITSGAVIKNLGVVNSYMRCEGDYYCGGIVGYAQAGDIEKTFFTGTIEGSQVGGLVGSMFASTGIQNCYVSATLNSLAMDGTVGGVVGYLGPNAGVACSVTNVYSSCIVHAMRDCSGATCTGGDYTGGIVGRKDIAYATTFTDCFYDKQLIEIINGSPYDSDIASIVGKTTTELTNGISLFASGFVVSSGLYPYISGFDIDKNQVYLSVVPITIENDQTLSDLSSVDLITLGATSSGVTWGEMERVGVGSLTAPNSLNVEGQCYVVLKATKNGGSRVFVLQCDKEPMLGTEANPFTIDSLADLSLFRDGINSYQKFEYKHFSIPHLAENCCFRQTVDIAMPDSAWESIGRDAEYPFKGIYDGGGHAVIGWKSASEVDAFFKFTERATVKNLTVKEVKSGVCAALIYSMHGGTVDNCHAMGSGGVIKGGLIFQAAVGDSCYILNSSNSNDFSARPSYAGGIIAISRADYESIKNCHNYGNITFNQSLEGGVGGIIGQIKHPTSEGKTNIDSCSNRGNIENIGHFYNAYTGGIIGFNSGGYSYVLNSFNTGRITAESYYVAGINPGRGNQIYNCYNLGEIIGGSSNTKDISEDMYVFGIGNRGTIENCFNAGRIINRTNGPASGIAVTSNPATRSIRCCINAGDVYANNGTAYSILDINNSMVGSSKIYNSYSLGRLSGNYAVIGGQYYDPARVPSFTSDSGAVAKGPGEMTGLASFEYTSGLYPRISALKDLTISKVLALPITFGNATDNVDSVTADFDIANDFGIKWKIENPSCGATIANNGTKQTVSLPADRTKGNIILAAYLESDPDSVYYRIELKMGVAAPVGLTVDNITDLRNLRAGVNSGAAFKYKGEAVPAGGKNTTFLLTADFSLQDPIWKPIGTELNPFKGIFDGGNHVLTDLNQSDSLYAGLFGFIDGGTVKNLTLKNVKINSSAYSGCVCAVLRAGTIQDCATYGEIKGCDSKYYSLKYYGGIVSQAWQNAKIIRCRNYANVAGEAEDYGYYSKSAGIVANCSNDTQIDTCINAGTISASKYTAGISATGGILNACINYGEVQGASHGQTYIQIAGIAIAPRMVTGCVNSGVISVPTLARFDTLSVVAGVSVGGDIRGCVNAGYIEGKNAYVTLGIGTGTCLACVNVGQVTGNNPFAVRHRDCGNCYYDTLMCTAKNTNATPTNTDGLCGTVSGISDYFTFTDQMYPRVKGMESLPASVAIATPIFLQNHEKVTFVDTDFPMGGCDSVSWTVAPKDSATLIINSCSAQLGTPKSIWLNAGVQDTVYKKIRLAVKIRSEFYIKNKEELANFRNGINSNAEFFYNPADSTFHASEEAAFIAVPANGENATFKLTNNIDLEGVGEWTPIGDFTNNNAIFKGVFDGNNYTISNFALKVQKISGLFGRLEGAEIKNLGINNASINSIVDTSGALVGYMANTTVDHVTIRNCVLNNSTFNIIYNCVGLLAGYISTSKVTNIEVGDNEIDVRRGYCVGGVVGEWNVCLEFKNAHVYNNKIKANRHVGGVLGSLRSPVYVSNIKVDTCEVEASGYNAAGFVGLCYFATMDRSLDSIGVYGGSVKAPRTIGGIVGSLGGDNGAVNFGYNSATINATDIPAGTGGIVGSGRGIIRNCINQGNVIGYKGVGGIVGDVNSSISVQYSVNTGYVKGESIIGGIVGSSSAKTNTDTLVKQCVNLGEVDGVDTVGGIVGINYYKCINNVNVGKIHGELCVGGLVGYNNGSVVSSYSAGQVWGRRIVGNVVASTDGTVSLCYYDKQMSPNYKGIGTTGEDVADVAEGAKTSFMTDGAWTPGGGFMLSSGIYPRPAMIANTDGAMVAAAPVVLDDIYTAYSIPASSSIVITPSVENGVSWDQKGEKFNKSGNDFTPQKAGRETLIASLNDMSKSLYFVIGNSKENPCVIKNADELRNFTKYVNKGDVFYYVYDNQTFRESEPEGQLSYIAIAPGGDGVYFRLDFDPSLSSLSWAGRIGTTASPFKGDFNGAGHTVYNLPSANHDTCGFFGFNTGKIYDLNIETPIMSDNTQSVIGAVCGYNTGDIYDCHVRGGVVMGKKYVGGLVGQNTGYVEYSHNSAAVDGEAYVGGVVGDNAHTVRVCFNMGDITASDTAAYVGGVVGKNTKVLSTCYNVGNIIATNPTPKYVGGVVGDHEGSSLEYCYNAGQVTAADPAMAGAIAGYSNNIYISSLAYDKQMCTMGKPFHVNSTYPRELLSDEMIGTSLSTVLGASDWAYEGGLYPQLEVMKDSLASVVSVTPVLLSTGQSVESVKFEFKAGSDHGIVWTTQDTNVLDLTNLPTVTLKTCKAGLKMTAQKGTDSIDVKNVYMNIEYAAVELTIDTACGGTSYTWEAVEDKPTYSASREVYRTQNVNGCNVNHILNLTIPDELQVNITHVDEQCYQDKNGQATATVSGGFLGEHKYVWTNSVGDTVGTSETIENLAPGKYYLKVSDKKPVDKDCFVLDSVVIKAAELLTANIDTFSVGCYAYMEGMFQVSAQGGTKPYTVSWVHGGDTSKVNLSESVSLYKAEGLDTGTYKIWIKDAHDCQTPIMNVQLSKDTTLYVIVPYSETKMYDGNSVNAGQYTLKIGNVSHGPYNSGDSYVLNATDVLTVVTSLDECKDANIYENRATFVVKRGGSDVTCQYNIIDSVRYVNISKRKVTLRSLDSLAFRGAISSPCLERHEIVQSGDKFTPADSATIEYNFTGEICDPGSGILPSYTKENAFTVKWNGVNPNNYDITYEYGVLTLIENGVLVVRADGLDKIFDNLSETFDQNSYSIQAYKIYDNAGVNDTIRFDSPDNTTIVGFSGQTYTVEVEMNNGHNIVMLDADTVDNEITGVHVYMGTGSEKVEITGAFTSVQKDNAVLRVKPREVVMKSGRGEWDYDGQPHSRPGVMLSGDGFLAGDLLVEPNASREETNAGVYVNTINYTLSPSVNPINYSIVLEQDTLIINKKELKLVGSTEFVDFKSGVEQSITGFDYVGLLTGHTASGISYLASGIDVGNHYGAFTGTLVVTDGVGTDVSDNYDTVWVRGYLGILSPDGKLIVKSDSRNEMYNGNNITAYSYKVSYKDVELSHMVDSTMFLLPTGDTVKVSPTGEAMNEHKNVGWFNNEFNYQIFPAANYGLYTNVVRDTGTVTIYKRQIKPTSSSFSRIYNGEHIERDSVLVGGYGFVEGEGADYTFLNPRTWKDVGTYPNGFTYTLKSNTDAGNYDIDTTYGKLIIEKATLKVKANDVARYYGDPNVFSVTVSGYQTGDDASVISGMGGISYDCAADQFSDIGDYDITPIITSLSADNYDFIAEKGNLHVDQRPLVVTAKNVNVVYDGQVHNQTTDPTTILSYNSLADANDVADIQLAYSRTTAGSEPMAILSKSIMRDGMRDVTDNYHITVNDTSRLIISKKPLTVTVVDTMKKYDGIPIVATRYTQAGLVTGDVISNVTYIGEQKDAGSSSSSIVFSILNSLSQDVSGCYSRTIVPGTLKVNPREVTMTSETASKMYDGTPLTKPIVTLTGDSIVNNEIYDIVATGSVTTFGEGVVTNTITYSTSGDYKDINYTITKVEGTLSILGSDKKITIISLGDTVIYDGGLHKKESYQLKFGDDFVTADASGRKFELLSGDTLTINPIFAGITNVSENSEKNNTFSYSISNPTVYLGVRDTVVGTVRIKPLAGVTVTVTGHNNSAAYDGAEHVVTGYEATPSTTLYTLADFYYTGDSTARRTEKGTTDMGLLDTAFHNTNSNFTGVVFSITDGYQTITGNMSPITITSADSTFTYDGTNHTLTVYTVTYDGVDVPAIPGTGGLYFELPTGDTLKITPTFGGIQNVADNAPGNNSFTYDLQNASNYEGTQTSNPGTLAIAPLTGITVTVKEHGGVTTYDGYEQRVSGYDEVSINNTLYTTADYKFNGLEADTIAKGRYVGSYQMNMADSQFVNLNANFDSLVFVIQDDSLLIKPNPVVITITAGSAEKLYDGTPLVDSSYTYVPAGVFAQGDSLVAEIEGTITEVGEVDNVVTGYKVYRNESFNGSMIRSGLRSIPLGYTKDVTACYTFATEMVKGKLTIYDTLALTVDSVSEPLCPGLNEGTVKLRVTGGKPVTPRYNYQVVGNVTHDTYTGTSDSTFSLSSLKPDTYEVTVTENLGYTITTTFEIKVREVITTANSSIDCPVNIDTVIKHGGCNLLITNIGLPVFHTTTSLPTSEITISNNAPSDNIYPVGETVVRWVAKSLCGDSIYCDQIIKVSFQDCPMAMDREQNRYPSVRLGSGCKCWTTENLKSTVYSDGRPIDNVMSYYSREYPNTDENVSIFGHLYTWYAAADTSRYGSIDSVARAYRMGNRIQGMCPEGWYLPSDDEYEELNIYPVSALRSTRYWLNVDGVVNTNSTGFNSLPSGRYNCATDRFEELMGNAYYWTCHPVYDKATGAMIDYICEMIMLQNNALCNGFSVRCIYDEH